MTPQPTNISHYNFNYQLKNIQPNPRPKTHCIVWLQHKPAGLLLTLNQDDPASFHPQSIKACNVPPCHILIHEDNLFDVISCILRSLCIDIWFWYSIFRFYPEARSISSCLKVAAVIRLWHIWLASSDSGVQRRYLEAVSWYCILYSLIDALNPEGHLYIHRPAATWQGR